ENSRRIVASCERRYRCAPMRSVAASPAGAAAFDDDVTGLEMRCALQGAATHSAAIRRVFCCIDSRPGHEESRPRIEGGFLEYLPCRAAHGCEYFGGSVLYR